MQIEWDKQKFNGCDQYEGYLGKELVAFIVLPKGKTIYDLYCFHQQTPFDVSPDLENAKREVEKYLTRWIALVTSTSLRGRQ